MTRWKISEKPLLEGEVRLIQWNLNNYEQFQNDARRILSAEEQERAQRYKVAIVAERFTITRALLRLSLGALLNADPQLLQFRFGEQGKPSLIDHTLSFNISHSDHRAVLVVARDRELGVDIERIRPLENDGLPERYFSTPEAIVYRVTPDDYRQRAFFHYWTAKEAFLKARGDGLSRGLADYSFSDPWETPPRLTWVKWDAEEPARWNFHRFFPEEGFMGTLAYSGSPTAVTEANEFKNL